MSKILGYLKSYVLSLIFMILLIGVMVGSDLALPNLMSDIISVGIQQGGVEHASPDAVSEKGLQLMTSFMTEEEQQLVKEQYVLEKAGSDSCLKQRTSMCCRASPERPEARWTVPSAAPPAP